MTDHVSWLLHFQASKPLRLESVLQRWFSVQHFDSKATQEVLQRPKKIRYPC